MLGNRRGGWATDRANRRRSLGSQYTNLGVEMDRTRESDEHRTTISGKIANLRRLPVSS